MAEDRLDRMGAFDAVMWGVEKDPLLRSVIVAMVVLDSEPDIDVLIDRVTRMTLAVPKLRQRVIGNPVSPIPPRWEFDPNFDLSYHLKTYHVPADGTDRPLMRIVEQMGEQDFDRNRPLWEMALVQGFDGARAAVIIKLHHAITDGVGGMAMAASLFDLSREPSADLGPLPAIPTADAYSFTSRLTNGARFLTSMTVKHATAITEGTVGIAQRAVSDPGETAVAGSAFAQSAARLLAPADTPLSPLMLGRSLSTSMAVIQVPFPALKKAAKAGGGTINDAYLAAVSGAMASYHAAHDSSAENVRVNMPVNLRSTNDSGGGNRWVPARFPLPVDGGDVKKRIQRLSPILKQARTEPALMLSDVVYRILTALPQNAATSVSAGMMKGCDLAVTNVPGPPIGLFSAGAKVEVIVPFAPKGGASANLGLMTYDGIAYVGVNIDTKAIPDPEVFLDHLRLAFDEILALADSDAHAVVGLQTSPAPKGAKSAPARRRIAAGSNAEPAKGE